MGKEKEDTHTGMQMKLFDDCFHERLHEAAPPGNVKIYEQQLS